MVKLQKGKGWQSSPDHWDRQPSPDLSRAPLALFLRFCILSSLCLAVSATHQASFPPLIGSLIRTPNPILLPPLL